MTLPSRRTDIRIGTFKLSMAGILTAVLMIHPLLAAEATVDFNTDVRPIFNRYCTSCHGGVKQAGDVSLIYRDRVLDSGIVEPGDPENSELLRRVLSDDPDERMPPPEKHPDPLTSEEIATIEKWIEQGAPWGNHWSLEPPEYRDPPSTESSTWPRQPLDHWVFDRLRRDGLSPRCGSRARCMVAACLSGPDWAAANGAAIRTFSSRMPSAARRSRTNLRNSC